MITSDKKVGKLMREYQKTGSISKSALQVDMDRKTARKYLRSGKSPSSMKKDRTWRTRKDPFEDDWVLCEEALRAAPELEATALFEWLSESRPGVYHENQLRTFQRRVMDWQMTQGPDKEVFFPQHHQPGVRMATDFTHMDSLGITLRGVAFNHMLCHCVLTYSNWEWTDICYSESLLALQKGVQSAIFRLGKVPREHWTDNSTSATHTPDPRTTDRRFNHRYQELMAHLGMVPKTIQVGEAHENGDVESLNGVLKRRIHQYLLLRGSRDFESLEAYEAFLHDVLHKANRRRGKRLQEEMAVMRDVPATRLPEYTETTCTVRLSGTISIKGRVYSVPSRLIGSVLRVHQYEDHIEAFYRGKLQLKAHWMRGKIRHQINYRHIIDSLARKPGAFRNYRYQPDLFPTVNFRSAYDVLNQTLSPPCADREYVQILKLAAHTMESEVDTALSLLLDNQTPPRLMQVLDLCAATSRDPDPIKPFTVNLSVYDGLLQETVVTG